MEPSASWAEENASSSPSNKIDRISGVQLENGNRTYLVHWKTPETSSWIPEESLIHAKDAVKTFITSLMTTFIVDNIDLKHKKKRKKKKKDEKSQQFEDNHSNGGSSIASIENTCHENHTNHISHATKKEIVTVHDEEDEPLSEFAITTVPFDNNPNPQEQINKAIMEQITSIHLPNLHDSNNGLLNTSSNYYADDSYINEEPSGSASNLFSYINQPPMLRSISPPNFLAQASLSSQLPVAQGVSPTLPHSSASLDSPLNHNKLLNILFSSEQNLDSPNSSSQNSSRSDFKSLPRLYTCKICNNSFKKSTHLSRHVRTHTGDKPFQCKYCPKAFARSDNLLVHERIHTGDKPFQCHYCPKTFTRSDKLTRHETSIHTDHTDLLGDKPFSCEICGRLFNTRSDRNRHISIHNDIDPERLNFLLNQK